MLKQSQGDKTYLFEAEGRAKKWVKSIHKLLKKSKGDDVTEEDWTQTELEAIPETEYSGDTNVDRTKG